MTTWQLGDVYISGQAVYAYDPSVEPRPDAELVVHNARLVLPARFHAHAETLRAIAESLADLGYSGAVDNGDLDRIADDIDPEVQP